MFQSCTWPIRGTCIWPLISVLKPPSSWSSSWKCVLQIHTQSRFSCYHFLGIYTIPEWFVRSESSSVLKLIPSAQQCWPEPDTHRDRSKGVNKVYCNIFMASSPRQQNFFVIFVSPKGHRLVTKIIFVVTVSPNTEKWGILEPTTPPTQDPGYNRTIMNWTKFNPCLVIKHASLWRF